MGNLNYRNFLFTVPKAEEIKICWVPAWLHSCESPFPNCYFFFFTTSTNGGSSNQSPIDLFYKSTDHIYEDFHLPKAHLLANLEIRISTYESRELRHTHSWTREALSRVSWWLLFLLKILWTHLLNDQCFDEIDFP